MSESVEDSKKLIDELLNNAVSSLSDELTNQLGYLFVCIAGNDLLSWRTNITSLDVVDLSKYIYEVLQYTYPPPFALEDTVMQERFREIIAEHGIKTIVETGIANGQSTVTFSSMVDRVIGVDNDSKALEQAKSSLAKAGCTNATLCYGSSPEVLRSLKGLLPKETLYFLDAHWQNYWPLLDEIKAITPEHGVIVLHDMLIPGHPELGFDTYDGQNLDYDYVKDALTGWSPKHRVEYNTTARCRIPRGVGYIFPE